MPITSKEALNIKNQPGLLKIWFYSHQISRPVALQARWLWASDIWSLAKSFQLVDLCMLCFEFIRNVHIDPINQSTETKKKKKIPTYLPTLKNLGRVTANKIFFKDGPAEKNRTHPFSHYKPIRRSRAANSAVGPIRPNFKLFRALMHVIITCKYKKEWMKKVGQTLSIHSQDIEQKPISDINQGPNIPFQICEK